ncbi:ABC transporter ATP-binding protein [Aquirufa sp. ROCK2-A2]
MEILATNINKKFRQEFVIRNFSFEIKLNQKVAILGHNGSGKSTLLKILAQYSLPTQGLISYQRQGEIVSEDKAFKSVSFVAPYVDLIEEYSLIELISFLQSVDYLPEKISINEFEQYIELSPSKDKLIKNYSSGMRQKVKLGTALLSNRPLLFLDEPTSNLDTKAKDWFKEKIQTIDSKSIIIASNEHNEIDLCETQINILDYK